VHSAGGKKRTRAANCSPRGEILLETEGGPRAETAWLSGCDRHCPL